MKIKSLKFVAREVAPWQRPLVALAEDPGPLPSTYMVNHGFWDPSTRGSDLHSCFMHMVTHMQAKMFKHEIKSLKN